MGVPGNRPGAPAKVFILPMSIVVFEDLTAFSPLQVDTTRATMPASRHSVGGPYCIKCVIDLKGVADVSPRKEAYVYR
jgi:hypothetical protein